VQNYQNANSQPVWYLDFIYLFIIKSYLYEVGLQRKLMQTRIQYRDSKEQTQNTNIRKE